MADLLVHFASACAVGAGLRDARVRAILYVGVCLPDVLYKGLLYGLGAPNWLCEPTHSPVGLALCCYVGALLFEEAWRKRAYAALLAGSYLHVIFDLAKNYQGAGVIPWAFPFSMTTVELGWYYPEDSLLWMIPSVGVILGVELVSRWRKVPVTVRATAGL